MFPLVILTLLSLQVYGNIIRFSQKTKGMCQRADSRYLMCCRHYAYINNSCQACAVGYYTTEEGRKTCQLCPPNKYGKKCAYPCICKVNERCDNKDGTCILWTTEFITFSENWTYMNDSKHILRNDSWQKFSYMAGGGVVLIVICLLVCASFVFVKKRSQRSEAGINVIPSVSPANLHSRVSNQVNEAAALYSLDHDYEEIDEADVNDLLRNQSDQFQNDSDSKEGSHCEPTEDDGGYLNPYHSLIQPHGNYNTSTVNITSQDGSTYWDPTRYNSLHLSKPIVNHSKKTIDIDTILKTAGYRSECITVYRKTI